MACQPCFFDVSNLIEIEDTCTSIPDPKMSTSYGTKITKTKEQIPVIILPHYQNPRKVQKRQADNVEKVDVDVTMRLIIVLSIDRSLILAKTMFIRQLLS